MMDSNSSLNTTMIEAELLFQNQLDHHHHHVSLPPQTNELAFNDFTWNSVTLTELVVSSHALIGFNEGIFASIYQHVFAT